MERDRPDQQNRITRVLGGRALDDALSALTEDWNPHHKVDRTAIGRISNPTSISPEDIDTEHLDDSTVNEELVKSWSDSSKEAPRVNGRPRRFDINPNRRLSRKNNKRYW